MLADDWLIQLRKGTIELCILALVAERERYGYEIVQELNAQGGMVIAEGTIYPLLKRLSKEGWVVSAWHESPSGPPRKYYRVTPRGRSYLNEISKQWQQFGAFINRLLGGVHNDFNESAESEACGGVSGAPASKPVRITGARKR